MSLFALANRARWIVWSQLYYPRRLQSFGRRSSIRRPLAIRGHRSISIGSSSHVRDFARLEVIDRPNEKPAVLTIGDGVLIEQNLHLVCSSRISIGDDVSIAASCAIVDTRHPMPGEVEGNVGHHILPGDTWVAIGDGTMLGFGVVVLPNVTIGKRCMIGANAVVTSDIPDDSVAVGSPARVVRTTSR